MSISSQKHPHFITSETRKEKRVLDGLKNSERIFVVHEHNATHLHWDFRLEMDGVLKSWALPKQPPKKKNIKRLAVQVEDHSLEYGKFEGEITEGYGKGTVKIWDKGTYKLIKQDKSKIEFELKGKKLVGKYVLVNAKLSGNKKNWLFFKV
jgi:bifunctional non-homologous end joining protein LigD